MSPPVRQSCAPNRGYTKSKKGRAQNVSIPRPGDHCAKEREGGKQSKIARLGVHFPLDLKGQRPGCPSPVRELMALSRSLRERPASERAGHLSESDRATRCPTGKIPPRGPGTASRPRLIGGVKRLVKYADFDVR